MDTRVQSRGERETDHLLYEHGVQGFASNASYHGPTCFCKYEATFKICTRTLSGMHLEKHQRYIQCMKHEAAIAHKLGCGMADVLGGFWKAAGVASSVDHPEL